ncbi:MAG: histidine kinase [Lachnospiraceae bacterium]|nr:histidine kinase [Lachnospiraceae bacterium]
MTTKEITAFLENPGNAINIINNVFNIVSIVLVMVVFISVAQMKKYSIRMGWFLAAICMIIGGISAEFMSENLTVYNLSQGESGMILAYCFFSLVAPLFALYFIETERAEAGEEQAWDGAFWTTLHLLFAFLVVILAIFDVGSFVMWFAFLLQYIVVIVMLFFSSKDISASVGFIMGCCFPITAAIVGIINNKLQVFDFGLVMLFLIVLFLYQQDTERELMKKRVELSESKVSLLMDQIHPHFIYNSLQQIALLCDDNSQVVKQSIFDFSAYLRSNFESLTNDGLIPFEKEMEHVDLYINLSKISPSRNFEVEKRFNVTDFKIPALSVQPLVENAIQYGIGMSTKGERIVIETYEEGGYYYIKVKDDGHGQKTQLQTQKKHKSVGTQNVRTRLKMMCEGTLEINRSEKGTESVIKIPSTKIERTNESRK